jgi:hypothetical protein
LKQVKPSRRDVGRVGERKTAVGIARIRAIAVYWLNSRATSVEANTKQSQFGTPFEPLKTNCFPFNTSPVMVGGGVSLATVRNVPSTPAC